MALSSTVFQAAEETSPCGLELRHCAVAIMLDTGGSESLFCAGSTYAPDGRVLTESGGPIETPADEAAVLQAARCCSLCNDSTLTYNTGAILHPLRTLQLHSADINAY